MGMRQMRPGRRVVVALVQAMVAHIMTPQHLRAFVKECGCVCGTVPFLGIFSQIF